MATIGAKLELEGAAKFKSDMANATSQTKLFQAQMQNLQSTVGKSTFAKSVEESKLLSKELANLKDKSAVLANQISEASAKYGENSTYVNKLKAQYENLQAQINSVDAELKAHGGTLGAIGAQLQETGSKIKGVGDKIAGFGDTLTTHVTAPIVALGGLSMKAFNEVDDAMDTLIKKTGATGEELEGLEDVVKNIATTMPTSFDKAANAVGEVSTRFNLTGDKLQSLSKSFLKFAELNDTDVSDSIDKVQSALAAYGFTAEDAAGYLDVLNAAGQETGTSVDKLAEDVATNAASMKEMGYSLTHASFLLANLSKNGVDSSSAMNGLKKAYANSLKTGESMSDTLLDLQNRLRNSETASDAAAEAIELFGTKSGGALVEAIQSGRMAFDDFSIAMGDYMGSVDSTFENTLDPIDELQTHMNELKLIGADLANSAMPMISMALDKLGQAIKNVSEFWNSLEENQQQSIINIALIVAAIGPLLSVGGRLISGFGSLTTMIGQLSSALPGLAGGVGAISAPVLGVVAAIGALVAAFVYLYQTNDEFKAKVQNTWTEIQGIFAQISVSVQAFLEALKGFWDRHSEDITAVLTALFNVLTVIVTTALEAIKAIIDIFTALLNGDMTAAFEGITNLVMALLTGIYALIQTYLNYAKAFITLVLNIVKELVSTVITAIKTKITEILNSIKEFITNTLNAIVQTITAKVTAVKQILVDLKTNITNIFKGLISDALHWGSDMIENFKNGIMSKMQGVLDSVRNMAQAIKDMMHFSEPDKGPLKDFNSWAPDMMKQYAQGIENGRYLVQRAVSDVTADVAVMERGGLDADEIYSAVNAGASDANISIVIGDRELGRALRNMGVVMA